MTGATPHQPDPHAYGQPYGAAPLPQAAPAGPWNDLQPTNGAAQPAWQPQYVQPVAAPPVAPAVPVTVAPAQPMPIAPNTAYHPPRAHGQDRTALAAVLTFAVVVVGLWAGLAYVHAMAKALASQDRTSVEIQRKLQKSNEGLAGLDQKTAYVSTVAADSGKLRSKMAGINESMSAMLAGVDSIGEGMSSLDGSLETLQAEITSVADTNASIGGKLATINGGLGSQARKVGQMRGDVQAASTQLGLVPPLLAATNARLTHVNGVVCYMGTKGISNDLALKISWLGIPNGSSTIHATMIPSGAWGC